MATLTGKQAGEALIVDIRQKIGPLLNAPTFYALGMLERKLTQSARRRDPAVTDAAYVQVIPEWFTASNRRVRIYAISPAHWSIR